MRVIEQSGFRVAYDPVVEAVSVRWRPPPYVLTTDVDEARHLDYDAGGRVAGAEFLYVDQGVDLRGIPRAAEFAALLGELGIRVSHAPAPDESPVLARAVAEWLASYRARHRLSMRALAAKLGAQHPTVVRLEQGRRAPNVETLERLTSRLGVRFVVYVGPAGTPPPTFPGAASIVCRDDGSGAAVCAAAGEELLVAPAPRSARAVDGVRSKSRAAATPATLP